jgi:hypothetical protein
MRKEPPLSVFYSYSQKDEKLRAQVDAGFAALERDRWITKIWYDQEIRPGDNWEAEIQGRLHQSDIILLLLSNNFNNSNYCMKEVEVALKRHSKGEARVIPIILTPALKISALSQLQALPRGEKPLSTGTKVNLTRLLEVSERIQEEIEHICSNGGSSESQRSPAVLEASQTVLAQLCNRVEQDRQIREAWQRHFATVPRRPFVCLVHGSVLEDHAGYRKRLTSYSLPQAIGMGADSEIRNPLPLKWPDYSADPDSKNSIMLGDLARALNCQAQGVATKLYQLGEASVVYYELFSDSRSYGDRATLKSFFDFWAAWPDLPVRQKLIVVLSVQYSSDDRTGFPNVGTEIVIDAAKSGQLSTVILDELPAVSSQHVKEWMRRQEIEKYCDVEANAAKWESQIDRTFLSGKDPMPMSLLIGPLNRMLDEYQRRPL